MTSIVVSGAVVVSPLLVVYAVFLAVARGVRADDDYEIEVKLLPPTIRLKVKRNDRPHRRADAVHHQIHGIRETASESEAKVPQQSGPGNSTESVSSQLGHTCKLVRPGFGDRRHEQSLIRRSLEVGRTANQTGQ